MLQSSRERCEHTQASATRRRRNAGCEIPKMLGRVSMVVAQHPAKSFAASNRSGTRSNRFGLDECVGESSVVPLGVVVRDVLPNRAAQRVLAEENHRVEALRFD